MYVRQGELLSFEEWVKTDRSSRLIQVLEALDAEKLLGALDQERRGRRDDYPNRVMWYSLLAGMVYGRVTIASLIEELHINPGLRYLCGIKHERGVPTASAFSRFIQRLMKYQELLETVFHQAVGSLSELLPELGKNVVIDSTDVHAYANEHRKPSADPDARWGVKGKGRNKEGQREPYRWLGYKVHLAVCGDYELPLAFKVTPANKPDGKELIPLLKDLKVRHPQVKERMEHVIADKGYDDTANYRAVVEEYGAKPVIPLNLGGEKTPPGICNHQGTPLCAAKLPMSYAGYDNGYLKYRAPCLTKGVKCPQRVRCCSARGYGLVVKLRVSADYRRYTPLPRETKKWQRVYNKRSAVERVNSRLKEHLLLDELRVRGLTRVRVRITLSLLVMVGAALAMAQREKWDSLRAIVRMVA